MRLKMQKPSANPSEMLGRNKKSLLYNANAPLFGGLRKKWNEALKSRLFGANRRPGRITVVNPYITSGPRVSFCWILCSPSGGSQCAFQRFSSANVNLYRGCDGHPRVANLEQNRCLAWCTLWCPCSLQREAKKQIQSWDDIVGRNVKTVCINYVGICLDDKMIHKDIHITTHRTTTHIQTHNNNTYPITTHTPTHLTTHKARDVTRHITRHITTTHNKTVSRQ